MADKEKNEPLEAEPKSCSKCGTGKPKSDFYGDKRSTDGLRSECKACHKDTLKQTQDLDTRRKNARKRNRRYLINNPGKFKENRQKTAYEVRRTVQYRARQVLSRAILRGKVVRPDECSRCGVPCKPQGHHDDYSRPLDVAWLCSSCHGIAHRTIVNPKELVRND